MIKKFPWGILLGTCIMICSFLTIAIVAVLVVSNMMIAEVGSDDGLSSSWWLLLIIIVNFLSLGGFITSLIFYIKRERILDKEELL